MALSTTHLETLLMLDRLLKAFKINGRPRPELQLGGELLAILELLAAEERRSVEALASELLWNAVAERHAAVENIQPWDELTPREKQTAALACLGHTNHEIAELMVISANTVKTHMRSVLRKFDVRGKGELRDVLAGWDFAGWVEGQELWRNSFPDDPFPVSSGGISP